MDKKLDKIENKLEDIDEKVDVIREVQIKMEADVRYRIKRTDELQNLVEKHDKMYYITMFIVAAVPIVLGIAATMSKLL